jgi:hypothetical protein
MFQAKADVADDHTADVHMQEQVCLTYAINDGI